MKAFSKFALYGLLTLASTSALAQATSPMPSNPQPMPSAPMSGMPMQHGSTQPGAQAPAQQGGMMECSMMKRSAETADAVKQLQQQMAEMRAMMEQMSKK